jgi:hypothetical protein
MPQGEGSRFAVSAHKKGRPQGALFPSEKVFNCKHTQRAAAEMVRRALVISPQSPLVIIAGCVLTALVLAGNHSVMNINRPLWIVLALVGFAFFGWWERIVKLWRKVSCRNSAP